MSESHVSVELRVSVERFAAAIEEVQRAIAEKLMPPIEALAVELRRWYNDWPGMPYTAPSLWDGEQMAAAR